MGRKESGSVAFTSAHTLSRAHQHCCAPNVNSRSRSAREHTRVTTTTPSITRSHVYYCPQPHLSLLTISLTPTISLTISFIIAHTPPIIDFIRTSTPELSLLGNDRSSRSSCCALSTHLYVLKPNLEHTRTHVLSQQSTHLQDLQLQHGKVERITMVHARVDGHHH